MKKGDKEFCELMEQFEKNIKELIYGHEMDRVSKEDKVPSGIFYNDGYINTMFHVYMMGYENAKCLTRLGAI